MAAAVQVAYLPAAPEQPGGALRGTRGRGLQGSGTLEARPARLHRATNRSLRPRELRGVWKREREEERDKACVHVYLLRESVKLFKMVKPFLLLNH